MMATMGIGRECGTARAPWTNGHIVSIQMLRGIAALQVVIQHLCELVGWPGDMAFGVDLFFVISGFVMVLTTAADDRPGIFLRRRLVRIVPLYWIATAIMIAILVQWRSPVDGWLVIASVLFIPTGNGATYSLPILPVGWTLNYELFFYALFALALFLPRAWRMAALLAALVALGFARPLLGLNNDPLRAWCDPIVWEFAAGIVLGMAWLRGWSLWMTTAGLAAAGVTLAAALWQLTHDPGNQFRFVWLIYIVPLFVAAISAEPFIGRIKSLAVFKGLGDASYSLYLFHPIAIAALNSVLPIAAFPPLARFLVWLVACLAAAFAVHHGLERPLLRATKRWAQGRRARPIASA